VNARNRKISLLRYQMALVCIVPETYQLCEDLSFSVKTIGSVEKKVECFTCLGDGTMLVPRYSVLGAEEKTNLVLPKPDLFLGFLRENQVHAVTRMYSDLVSYGSSIGYLYTGFGKTACALYIAACLRPKIVNVYVHKLALVLQWQEAAKQFVPGIVINILTVQKQLHNLSEMHDVKDALVILDEAHHYPAHCFSRILSNTNARYVLALSATVERRDGLSKILDLYLGSPSVNITNLTLKPRVYVSKFDGGENLYDFTSRRIRNETVLDYNDVINKLVASEERNIHILDVLEKLGPRNVLILSRRRGHVEHLYLQNKERDSLCDNRILVGNMKKADIETAKQVSEDQQFLRLFATTGAASEGFDMSILNTVLFATPSCSVQQEVGRILRKEQVTPCLVVDVVDNCRILWSQYSKRKRFYDEHELEYIKTME